MGGDKAFYRYGYKRIRRHIFLIFQENEYFCRFIETIIILEKKRQ